MNSYEGKISYHTLGCKLNFAETGTIAKALTEQGYITAQSGDTPDFCIINTCSVTDVADKKGRQLISKLHRRYPLAKIIVTGCYAQLKPQEVSALQGVSLVVGQDKKGKIPELVKELKQGHNPEIEIKDFKDLRSFVPACEKGERTRYQLKVQDGCDYFCSYCTIPMARGRSRSASIEQCLEQARNAAAEGACEIVLTGVNVGEFGKGTDENFLQLIQALDKIEGIKRYRISSIEPNLLTHEIIDFVASSRAFMPHFHVPLQSGSDHVLGLMRRRYNTALFTDRINYIRKTIPDAFIGVDIIAGARGETPEHWLESLEYVKGLDVQQLHVFPYSERPGTRALLLGNPVKQEDKHKRVSELLGVSTEKYKRFLQRSIGEQRPVLWESPKGEQQIMHGFTDNYIRVEAPYRPELINTITHVTLGAPIDDDTLSAQ